MKKLILMLFAAVMITSCGYKEGIIQKSDQSFLKFTGNRDNVSVQVDNAEPFTIHNIVVDANGEEKRVSGNNKLYQVSPGKHIVKVFRDGQLVVNRVLILDNNVIKEVRIP